MYLDMVRAGVILYGMEPSLSVEHHADFRPVLSLHAVISHVKEIEPGSDISYDRTFTAKERMRVATIPVATRTATPAGFRTAAVCSFTHALPDFR